MLEKEVILSEINLISAKVDSLKDQTAVNIDSVMPWSDVVAGRKKASYTLQKKPCQILVINNCYDLFSLNERCGKEINRLSEVQQIKGSGKYNKKTLNQKQNTIIILGDSHTRGCAQDVQHNSEHGFKVHGIVKPGANTEIIINTSTKIIEKLTKKDVVLV